MEEKTQHLWNTLQLAPYRGMFSMTTSYYSFEP